MEALLALVIVAVISCTVAGSVPCDTPPRENLKEQWEKELLNNFNHYSFLAARPFFEVRNVCLSPNQL